MRHWKVTIKETSGHVLTPELTGDYDRNYLVKFFGLNDPDVESYVIEEIQ